MNVTWVGGGGAGGGGEGGAKVHELNNKLTAAVHKFLHLIQMCTQDRKRQSEGRG